MAKIYRDITELAEGAQEACKEHINACLRAGLDIFITETYRSQERQNELYQQGRSKPGKIVTNTRHSNHTARRAWDISFRSTGYTELSKFYTAGRIAGLLDIDWGGKWKSNKDNPHFEYKGVRYMLPTAFKQTETLSEAAAAAGIITEPAIWYNYMTGITDIKRANVIALFKRIAPGVTIPEIAAAAQKAGYITCIEYWVDVMTGARICSPGNLRALFTKVTGV